MQASQASRRPRQAGSRAFIPRHTRLRPVPGLDEIRLHLADEAVPLWGAVATETADPDTPLPYWAFAWGGGLAIAHYLRDHPEIVAGRRVFDLGAGSGLCAIAAMQAGATAATAADIDPFAIAAIERNARANSCRITILQGDALEGPPPDVDIVLAGDCWYDAGFADRVTPWLRQARASGMDVIVGDPGRRFFPATEVDEIGAYDVRTTTDLEDLDRSSARVYRLRAPVSAQSGHRATTPV